MKEIKSKFAIIHEDDFRIKLLNEKPKDVDVIDISDKNLKEAGDSLLEFLEEDKMKHRLQLN